MWLRFGRRNAVDAFVGGCRRCAASVLAFLRAFGEANLSRTLEGLREGRCRTLFGLQVHRRRGGALLGSNVGRKGVMSQGSPACNERRAWSARLRSSVNAEVLQVRRRKFNWQALTLVRRRAIWIWGSGMRRRLAHTFSSFSNVARNSLSNYAGFRVDEWGNRE